MQQRRKALGANHHKEAVTGPELMELMKQQAKNFGTRVITDDIVKVDFRSHPFKLFAASGEVTETHAVIIATGARANYLGLDSENNYKNRGVSACAVCDGALPRFRNKPLVVVGGGDSAVEEASYLTKFASKVYMVHRRDQLRASKIMAERAKSNSKIEFVWNSGIDEVARRHWHVPGDRPHAQHGVSRRTDRDEREGLHQVDHTVSHRHECRRRLRRR
jgi:thioredoxin reductase (NADPH)